MDPKDTQTSEESQKYPIRTIPVDAETLEKVRLLQEQFSANTFGGRISQTVIANRAITKLTLADLLPKPGSAK